MATNENKQLRDANVMVQSEKEKQMETISGLEADEKFMQVLSYPHHT